MKKTTASKLLLLGSLYLSQGLPFGFFTQALPVMMRQKKLSLGAISLTSLLALPWALKFLWAPLVDTYGSKTFGMRKSWIVPLQVLTALSLIVAVGLEPTENFFGILTIVLCVNFFSATQDIATDGLAVDLLTHQERGLANGLQVAAYRVGMVLSGGLLLMLYPQLGWKLSFLLMAAMVLVASLGILFHREVRQETVLETMRSPSAHFLANRNHWVLLSMLFVFKLGESFASSMLKPFLVDHEFGVSDIGWLVGTVGSTAAMSGAMVGGWLSGRIRRKRALLFCAVIQALAVGSYVFMATSSLPKSTLAWVVAIEYFTSSMATSSLFTCMMDFCRPGHSGSDYTVQASTVVIAQGISQASSGFFAQSMGYAMHFSVSFALCMLAILAVAFLFPKKQPDPVPLI